LLRGGGRREKGADFGRPLGEKRGEPRLYLRVGKKKGPSSMNPGGRKKGGEGGIPRACAIVFERKGEKTSNTCTTVAVAGKGGSKVYLLAMSVKKKKSHSSSNVLGRGGGKGGVESSNYGEEGSERTYFKLRGLLYRK